MGPHSGLSLRGGTGYPAPHWNLELGTWIWQPNWLDCGAQYRLKYSEYKIGTFNMNDSLKRKIKYYCKYSVE